RLRELERPHLFMTSEPDREREETASAASSAAVPAWTLTTLVGFLTVLLFVYAIHRVLLSFIVAGVIAYVCTPLVDALSRYGPRTLMAVAVFLALLAIAAGLALLGLPALIAESSQVLGDFGGTTTRLVQGVIGNRTVALFGQPMDASQITEVIVGSARNWLKQGGSLVDLASWSFGAFFGVHSDRCTSALFSDRRTKHRSRAVVARAARASRFCRSHLAQGRSRAQALFHRSLRHRALHIDCRLFGPRRHTRNPSSRLPGPDDRNS